MPKGYVDSPTIKRIKLQKAIDVVERKLAALKTRAAFEESPPSSKTCSLCRTVKPIDHFVKRKKNIDGFHCWCRQCQREEKKKWHTKHKDSENANSREYSKKHAAEIRANRLQREMKNPGIQNERAKKYQQDHAEELRLKRWSVEGRAKAKKRNRQWRAANPEKSREKCRRLQAIRWYKAKANPVSYVDVYERDNGICYLCNKNVEKKDAHFDHAIPLSKGGSHTLDNIKTTHRTCNLRKGQNIIAPGAFISSG